MKFTAYDPMSGEKVYLKEYICENRYSAEKIYYRDDKQNFVYDICSKQLFEMRQYVGPMQVEINNKRYYLIGEF